MENELITEQIAPSARLLGIKFDLLTGDDIEKYSIVNVNDAVDLTSSKLGLPNTSSQCTTCGATNMQDCEGHFGLVKLPATIYHPHLVHDVVQILNQICPACKSIKKDIKKDLQIKRKILALRRLLLKMKFEKLKLPRTRLPSHVANVHVKQLKISGLDKKWARAEDQSGCKYCLRNSGEWYPAIKFKILLKDAEGKKCVAITAEINEKPPRKFRNRCLSEVLPKDFWSFVPMLPGQHGRSESMDISRLMLSPVQAFYLLRELDQEFIKLFVPRRELIFLSCIPVSPNSQRVMEISHAFAAGPRLSTNRDKCTKAYKAVVDASRKIDEFHHQQQFGSMAASHISSRVQDCINVSKLHSNNTSVEDHPSYSLRKKDQASCTGLRWIKEVVLSKRSDNAFRMTMIGDPKIQMGEIGLPPDVAEGLCIAENVNVHNVDKLKLSCDFHLLSKDGLRARRKGKVTVLRASSQLQIGDIFDRPLDNGDIILVNRPPSVHQHSLLALSVRILPIKSVVSINPLCCAPLLGDFDGDCLHGYVPQSACARIELNELLSLDHQLCNGQSGQNLLSLTHDSLTAAYLLRVGKVSLNKFEMQQLEVLCPRKSQYLTIIKDPDIQNHQWKGQDLFNMLLPCNVDLSAGSSMSNFGKGDIVCPPGVSSPSQNEISGIISRLFKCHGRKALDYLFSAQEVFCEYLTIRGLSVSLRDIYLTADPYIRNKLMDEIRYGLEEAKGSFYFNELMLDPGIGLLLKTHDENDDLTQNMNISSFARETRPISPTSIMKFKDFFRDIQNIIRCYISEDNSLLTMERAGSKGSLLKLVQQGVCVGLQLYAKPLPFSIPVKHSCPEWNRHKAFDLSARIQDRHDSSRGENSHAVIEASFLDGLSPLECFIHALSCRANMFSENAELPGTLTRKLMFYMRDIYVAYDGTVRNPYGQHLVQFSYGSDEEGTNGVCEFSPFSFEEDSQCNKLGGQPVGSLAACSICEAAYGALDHPVNSLESSPLLNLKKVLECAPARVSVDRTASLFLSKKLKRLNYGFEYGALAVKNHLERVYFSDVVTAVMIFYAPPDVEKAKGMRLSPWISHFHLNKGRMMRRRINLSFVLDVLTTKYNLERQKDGVLPSLFITTKNCIDIEEKDLEEYCIQVAVDNSDSPVLLDTIRDLVIPVLLRIVMKGFTDFKQVDILWDSQPATDGQLCVKVAMAESCPPRRFWHAIRNACISIMDLIDWEQSRPDGVYDISDAFGIISAHSYFLKSLKLAASSIPKNIHPEHLRLVSNSLSVTGEFHGLSAKGLKQQRAQMSISSPFTQACFSNPEKCFIEAGKQGSLDNLSGTVDAVGWGQEAQVGTGGPFEIMYSAKGCNERQTENIYGTLLSMKCKRYSGDSCQINGTEEEGQPIVFNTDRRMRTSDMHHYWSKKKRMCGFNPRFASTRIGSWGSIVDMITFLRELLYRYSINDHLNETDKSLLMEALMYHPRKDAKIGIGIKDIKIGHAPLYPESRCFVLVRNDGTTEDFSYHKCAIGAATQISPAFGLIVEKELHHR